MENYDNKLTTFDNPELDEILCWGKIEPKRINIYNKE